MESETIVSETASQSSGSSSSSSSSASSHDSDNETSFVANSVTGKNLSSDGDGMTDGESVNGGFLSGEEDFEAALETQIDDSEEQIVVGADDGSGEKLGDRGDSSGGGTVMSEGFRPVAKVTDDDDDVEEENEPVEDGLRAKGLATVIPEVEGFVFRKLRELGEMLDSSVESGVTTLLGDANESLVNEKHSLPEKIESEEGLEVSPLSEADLEMLNDDEKAIEEEPKIEARVNENTIALNEDEVSAISLSTGITEADSAIVELAEEKLVGAEVIGSAVISEVADPEHKKIDEPLLEENYVDAVETGYEVVSEVANSEPKKIDESSEVPVLEENHVDAVENGGEVDANVADIANSADDGMKMDAHVDGSGTDATLGNEETKLAETEPEVDSEGKQGDLSANGSEHEGKAQAVDSSPAHEVKFAESNGTIAEAQEHAVEDGISNNSKLIVDSEEYKINGIEDDCVVEDEGSETDEEKDGMIFGNSDAAKQFLEELERGQNSEDQSQQIDGQIVTDSEEEVDTDDEGDGKELFDSAALAALLKAATGADTDGGNITITSQDGSRLFSVERPAGLGSSLRSLKPTPRPRPNIFSSNLAGPTESETNLTEEEKQKAEKIQQLRVKFLRLVQRVGHSAEESLVQQVMYRLSHVAGRQISQWYGLDAAKRSAAELEAEGKDGLDFSMNILVLGKSGVGKSATINSILGEAKAPIHAFEPATTAVKEIVGTIDGVRVRFFDTPGLKSALMEQSHNRRILTYIKNFTKKCPPDIVLYVDRLDTQTRDLNDLPLLKTITSCLGNSIWRSAVVTLTHAASAPPDGPSGNPLNYDAFITQRSHIVQQSIGQAVGDLRLMNPSLMNPVSLVENHPNCRKNRDGEKVLPNGQAWRSQLLLLCYSMKILSEATGLSKPQDPVDHRKLFGFRVRSPPLPYLLSWLLQSRAHPKLTTDQGLDNEDSDVDLADLCDSDQEDEEDEYDQLPPFKPLRKSQLAKLSKEQKKAYLEEYDYRVKLLQKKQLREELKRMREIKKNGKAAVDELDASMGEEGGPEDGSPAAVPVPLHDMVLPPTFDSDNPAYRYGIIYVECMHISIFLMLYDS